MGLTFSSSIYTMLDEGLTLLFTIIYQLYATKSKNFYMR
tara:strand:+ start:666 stop:782 length:117 start_codon:yes stop_codon:yes gene_type:complete